MRFRCLIFRKWEDARQQRAAESVIREKAAAKAQVKALPICWSGKDVMLALNGFHFRWRKVGDGLIRKSNAEIAAKAGVSENTVRRRLNELERMGLIERVKVGCGRGIVTAIRVIRFNVKTTAEAAKKAWANRQRYLRTVTGFVIPLFGTVSQYRKAPTGKPITRVRADHTLRTGPNRPPGWAGVRSWFRRAVTGSGTGREVPA